VEHELDFYHLKAILAVGYRVNSKEATSFRRWATKTLDEFVTKGYVLDNKRLKQKYCHQAEPRQNKIGILSLFVVWKR